MLLIATLDQINLKRRQWNQNGDHQSYAPSVWYSFLCPQGMSWQCIKIVSECAVVVSSVYAFQKIAVIVHYGSNFIKAFNFQNKEESTAGSHGESSAFASLVLIPTIVFVVVFSIEVTQTLAGRYFDGYWIKQRSLRIQLVLHRLVPRIIRALSGPIIVFCVVQMIQMHFLEPLNLPAASESGLSNPDPTTESFAQFHARDSHESTMTNSVFSEDSSSINLINSVPNEGKKMAPTDIPIANNIVIRDLRRLYPQQTNYSGHRISRDILLGQFHLIFIVTIYQSILVVVEMLMLGFISKSEHRISSSLYQLSSQLTLLARISSLCGAVIWEDDPNQGNHFQEDIFPRETLIYHEVIGRGEIGSALRFIKGRKKQLQNLLHGLLGQPISTVNMVVIINKLITRNLSREHRSGLAQYSMAEFYTAHAPVLRVPRMSLLARREASSELYFERHGSSCVDLPMISAANVRELAARIFYAIYFVQLGRAPENAEDASGLKCYILDDRVVGINDQDTSKEAPTAKPSSIANTSISLTDLLKELQIGPDHPSVEPLINGARDGYLTLKEFTRTFSTAYDSWRYLQRSQEGFKELLNVLRRMTIILSLGVGLFIYLVVLGVPKMNLIISSAALISSLSLALSDVYSNFMKSFIFVAVNRPYRVGDRIRLNSDNQLLIVEKVSMFYSEFLDLTGKVHIINHCDLVARHIINETRSPHATFEIVLNISAQTDPARIEQLKLKMKHFLKGKKRHEFQPDTLYVYVTAAEAGHFLTLAIYVSHRESWARVHEVWTAKTHLILFILQAMRSLNIEYTLPKQPITLDQPLSPSLGLK